MSHAISVPTPFNDISELGESFASRVDEERLMLPHTEPVPEGEWVQFAVTLADGSAALSGMGRCTSSFDNGEGVAPEHRFDVVMDSLQLDEMAQIYFERILQARAAQFGEEPQTGEVLVPTDEEIAFAEAQAALAATAAVSYSEPPQDAGEYASPSDVGVASAVDVAGEADWNAGEPTEFGDAPVNLDAALDAGLDGGFQAAPAYEDDSEALDSVELSTLEEDDRRAQPAAYAAQLLAAPAESAIYELPPPTAPAALPSPHANGAVLTRRALTASWSPEPTLRPDPSPSSGYFQYAMGAGLPQPPEPPRPDLEPSLRVMPAPRPGDAVAAPAVAAYEAAPAAFFEDEATGDVAIADGAFGAGASDGDGFGDEMASYEDEPVADYGTEHDEETRQVDIGELATADDDDGMALHPRED